MRRLGNKGFADFTLVLMIVATSAFVVAAFMALNSYRDSLSVSKRVSDFRKVYLQSALDTFMQAYRFAEIAYIREVSSCDTARPFQVALAKGSGCPKDISVFSKTNGASDPGASVLYTYSGDGCVISQSSSTCDASQPDILTIGVGTSASEIGQKIGTSTYRVTYAKALPELQTIEFSVSEAAPGSATEKTYKFAVRGNFSNAAHLEGDGRVVQETPVQLAPCPGQPWATYNILVNGTCTAFSQFGAGSGLIFYRNRFFGFRPFDGIIVDLLAGSDASNSSYIVNYQTGEVEAGKGAVFVPYPNPSDPSKSLLGIDDLTMIQDQMYYVSGFADSAQIGHVAANGTRTEVCDLSALGWSQAYTGITALSWSDPLMDDASNPLDSFYGDRLAIFQLKTDSGSLLTASVIRNKSNGKFECFVVKNEMLQQIEFMRTLGFDRTVDEKPYYIY